MSVPVPQRGHGELEVNTKARVLTVYTLKILENEKWFPKEQIAFITKLQDCAIEIQALCWEANNIKVGDSMERYRRRIELQDEAGKCSRENVDASWGTWIDHISKGNSYRLIQRLNKFYSDLWKGDGKDDPQETHDDTCRTGCTGECGSSGGKECCQH